TDFGGSEPLFGLFATRRQATEALQTLADAHALCPVVLGLEKPTLPGRPCFAFQVHKCKGACVGQEPLAHHSLRLQMALARMRLQTWTYPGAIGLVERNDFLDVEEVHLVDGWRYLGTAKSAADVDALLQQAAHVSFDRDTYKLLTTQLAKGKLTIRHY
ncbi:MAG: ethanolamine utilization protein, partial [Gammaproteobacteria bacterium]